MYQNLTSPEGSFLITTMSLVVVDENIKYVSVKYDSRRADKYDLYNYENKNYYGEVSYIKSDEELTDVLNDYLDSFDIFSWASFIPS